MDKLPEYASRLAKVLPGVEVNNLRLCSKAGLGTDLVIVDERFVALFCTNPVSYTAPQNAEMCGRIRKAITLAIPEAIAAAEGVVVFKKIIGVPLEQHWLLRQTEAIQQTLADQIGGFLRELHARPLQTFDGLKLRDCSMSLQAAVQLINQIQKIMIPELLPANVLSTVLRVVNDCKTFLGKPQMCERRTFQHGDLGPRHILVDHDALRLSGILDFGYCAIGDPARDMSYVLMAYGETFAVRMFRAYPEAEQFLDRARFLAGMFYLLGISRYIQRMNEHKRFSKQTANMPKAAIGKTVRSGSGKTSQVAAAAGISAEDKQAVINVLDKFATTFQKTKAPLSYRQFRTISYVLAMLYVSKGNDVLVTAFDNLFCIFMRFPESADLICTVNFATLKSEENRNKQLGFLKSSNVKQEDIRTFVAVWGAYSLANDKAAAQGTTLETFVEREFGSQAAGETLNPESASKTPETVPQPPIPPTQERQR